MFWKLWFGLIRILIGAFAIAGILVIVTILYATANQLMKHPAYTFDVFMISLGVLFLGSICYGLGKAIFK